MKFQTREVKVGSLGIGGKNPIRIQSMTTTPTQDVEATVTQAIQLYEKGCELVRVTVQGKKEAFACEKIKTTLLQKGYDIPLVADIHFYPPAALKVLDFVDKVRINPGNFLDRRATFKKQDYDEKTYAQELLRLEEGFSPLVEKCKKLNKAMRIGTNHGSLSDRIMNRYGDTPEGMVESALEYARVCRKLDFHNFIFSMKASQVKVMIAAYRLLVDEMRKLSWDYPLHLGVTEAGAEEEGRIKSAIGIGSLLCDGIGDTIRVSLTEDPTKEILPAKKLVELAHFYQSSLQEGLPSYPMQLSSKRTCQIIKKISPLELRHPSFFSEYGLEVEKTKLKKSVRSFDGVLLEKAPQDFLEVNRVMLLMQNSIWVEEKIYPLTKLAPSEKSYVLDKEENWELLLEKNPKRVFLRFSQSKIHLTRKFEAFRKEHQLSFPILLDFTYQEKETALLQASMEVGSLLCDGLIDGVSLEIPAEENSYSLLLSILQATGYRNVKTDYISCPSCGRTLFDLQEVSKKIREKTSHLPGVKIAIMGCIVNGPGEMADADFGYVGSTPGKIDLYLGKTCVEKGVDFSDAVQRLIALIQQEGKWQEPPLKEVLPVLN